MVVAVNGLQRVPADGTAVRLAGWQAAAQDRREATPAAPANLTAKHAPPTGTIDG